MVKTLVLFLLLIILTPGIVLASEAYSRVETKIEGEGSVYQYIETTVNGQTVKKESSQPGRLEFKMQGKEQEPVASSSVIESVVSNPVSNPVSVFVSINKFFEQFEKFLDEILKIF